MGNSAVSLPFPCAWKPLLKHAEVPKSMDFGTRCTWACTLFFWDEFFLPYNTWNPEEDAWPPSVFELGIRGDPFGWD